VKEGQSPKRRLPDKKRTAFVYGQTWGGHLLENWTGELCHKEDKARSKFSQKKAHKSQNERVLIFVTYVPFCG
jgi:hypothetical protein